MAKKERPLSDTSKTILEFLKESDEALTLAEIKEKFPEANSAHLTALRNRDLVVAEQTEKEVTTIAKRKVNTYSAVEVEDVEEEESAE